MSRGRSVERATFSRGGASSALPVVTGSLPPWDPDLLSVSSVSIVLTPAAGLCRRGIQFLDRRIVLVRQVVVFRNRVVAILRELLDLLVPLLDLIARLLQGLVALGDGGGPLVQ